MRDRLNSEVFDLASMGENSKKHFQRGMDFYKDQNYSEAIIEFNQCVGVAALIARGSCYNELNEYEKAITDFTIAIELDPEENTLYYDRGDLYLKLKEYEKSIQDYDKAIDLGFDTYLVYTHRAVAYHYLGNDVKAMENFVTAYALKPAFFQISKSEPETKNDVQLGCR